MPANDLKSLDSIDLNQQERLILQFLREATWEGPTGSPDRSFYTVRVPDKTIEGTRLVQSWCFGNRGGDWGLLSPFIRKLSQAGIITMSKPLPVKPTVSGASTGYLRLPQCDLENLGISLKKGLPGPG